VFQTKVVEEIKIYILWSKTFSPPKFLPFMRQCGKNIVERGRPQMTVWRMRIACWLPKDTNTHSEYVILIAFPLQQWLHERPSVLRYTYSACLI